MYPILVSPRGTVSPSGPSGRFGAVLRRLLTLVAERSAPAVERGDNRLPPEYFRFPLF